MFMERKGLFGKENSDSEKHKGYSNLLYTALSNSLLQVTTLRRNTQAQKQAYNLDKVEKSVEKVLTGGDF